MMLLFIISVKLRVELLQVNCSCALQLPARLSVSSLIVCINFSFTFVQRTHT